MRVTRRRFSVVIASSLAFGCVGCATMSDKSPKNQKSFMERLPWVGKKGDSDTPEPYPNPVKMAATWTPDTLVQTGRTPTRGFGGRIFFYDEKTRAVPVDGSLVVHGFDDLGDPENRVKRFEFTPEQFTRHFSQTDLGASYSVWIPWDAVGGEQRRISLVTSFKTVEGKLVQGIPATVLLPGVVPEATAPEEFAKLSPQYRKYREATDSPKPSSGLTTTTIARRRSSSASATLDSTTPGMTIPPKHQPAMVAAGNRPTPSIDVQMLNKPTSPEIMPASAIEPLLR